MHGISKELLSSFEKKSAENQNIQVLGAAVSRTELKDLAYVPANAARLNGDFEVEVKTRGITAQQKSGRCWMFAALNLLREGVAERLNLKEFEFSQNYLTFYDKLEKADNFLNMVIANADQPLNGQIMQYILRGIDDGGYWGMAKDLIEKYGVVPKSAYPETYQSDHTETFLKLINEVLRKDAMELRNLIAEGKDVSKRREEMLAEVYQAECIAFGTPVQKFDFEYRDAEGNYHSHKDLTPHQFYEIYVGKDLDDYVAVINEPTANKKMETPVVFHSLGNMADTDLFALNLPMDQLESLCVRSLRGGDALWFACDAGAYGARKEGVWDPDSFTYGKLLGGMDAAMPKKERLEYRNSAATHAMLLTGVNFDEEGRANRWKIENSWGKENGRDGYYVCSESYFREYVYEAVVSKKYLSDSQKAMLAKKPVVIPAWEEE
jgi:bleomycin hydrolase